MPRPPAGRSPRDGNRAGRATDDDVFVIDTLGELMAFYACADVAFVGGSLQAIGGHNLLEPAAVGTAMVTGPHLHNFAEISRRLNEAGALVDPRRCRGHRAALQELLPDPADACEPWPRRGVRWSSRDAGRWPGPWR